MTYPINFYGWVTNGNVRTEIYKSTNAHGEPVWTSRQTYHGNRFGQGADAGRRIASECVSGYDTDPDFNRV